MTNAPDNGGFTVTSAGFIRLWLADDDQQNAGSDIYARPGERYPLNVAAYEFIQGSPSPEGLSWLPADLGGYRSARPHDGEESFNVSGSVGLYVVGDGTLTVDDEELTLSSGDFVAGAPVNVVLGDIGYFVAIHAGG